MMRIKLPDGRETEALAWESEGGGTAIVLGVVKVGPGPVEDLHLVEVGEG